MTFDRTSMMLLSGLDITMAYKCHACISLNNREKYECYIYCESIDKKRSIPCSFIFKIIIIILMQSKIRYKNINKNYNVEEKAVFCLKKKNQNKNGNVFAFVL